MSGGNTVEVEDNGTGVDDALKEKIFDPYFTTKHEGTGLGLSLCSKIVEDHHGSISIEQQQRAGHEGDDYVSLMTLCRCPAGAKLRLAPGENRFRYSVSS